MDQINTALLKKYLEGDDLSPEELAEIEHVLLTNEALAEKIAQELKEPEISAQLKKGIQETGKAAVKKKIQTLNTKLQNTGFFIGETQIQEYLKGTLIGPDLAILEQRLQTDEDFVKRVEEEQHLLAGIQQFGKETVKNKLTTVEKNLEQKGFFEEKSKNNIATKETTKVISLFNRRVLSIAASLLLLVSFFYWSQQQNRFNPEQSFATHFTLPPDNISEDLSETGFVKEAYFETLEAAMEAYQNQDFPKATVLFEKYKTAAPTTDEFYKSATFYHALTYLETNKTQAAINLLEPLSKQTFDLQMDAKWYLALAYLKNKELEKSKLILNTLTNTTHAAQAKSLLGDLK